jgi:arylsulfatase A-like enzyme
VPLPRLISAVAFALIAGLVACAPRAGADARGPDVLLITFDALPGERVGFLGAPESVTPALDAFAADAVVLERATAPWSLPALASCMSGAPVEAHRCDGPAGVLAPHFITLAERLLAAGYETACVVSERFATSQHGLTQGFVHVDESLAFPEVDPLLARPAQALAARAIRFVEQRATAETGPWLLWLHWVVPPADAAGEELLALDSHVGRVLVSVRERGRSRGSVVLVASGTRAPAGAPVQAPLVLSAPGLEPARSTVDARPIDLVPTLLALTGLPPGELPGKSVVP